MKNAAQSLRELYEEESRIKNMAIIQCLKAAETGRQVAQMIRDYKSLTVGEVLTLSQQSMKKLLVTGASGFLGWNICQTAKKEWEIFGTVFSHPIEELKALRGII